MNYTTGSVDGGVDGSTVPFIDSVYDVGSSTKRYRNGHFVDVYVGSGTVDLTTAIATDISAASAAILATKGQTEGICPLSGGLIPSGHIPPLAITSATVYASIAARDADSSVLEGDAAIVTDVQKSYIFDGSVYVELLTTGSIATINGKTGGVVTLNTAEVPESGDARYYTAARAAGPMAVSSVSTTGNVAVSGSLNVGVYASVNGNLDVVGTLAGNTMTMTGGCAVGGSITGADLTTTGGCAVGGSLTGNDLAVAYNATVAGSLIVGGGISCTNTIVGTTVTGQSSVISSGILYSNGTTSFASLDVVSGGTSNFSGPVVGVGTLEFNGPTNVFQNLVSLPGTTTSNILDVTTLSVSGNANLAGVTTLNGGTVTNNLTVSGDLTVVGDVTHPTQYFSAHATSVMGVNIFSTQYFSQNVNTNSSFAGQSSSEFSINPSGKITYTGSRKRLVMVHADYSLEGSVANTQVFMSITKNGVTLISKFSFTSSTASAITEGSMATTVIMDTLDEINLRISNYSGTSSIGQRHTSITGFALSDYVP
jgi:hypothetical protein